MRETGRQLSGSVWAGNDHNNSDGEAFLSGADGRKASPSELVYMKCADGLCADRQNHRGDDGGNASGYTVR